MLATFFFKLHTRQQANGLLKKNNKCISAGCVGVKNPVLVQYSTLSIKAFDILELSGKFDFPCHNFHLMTQIYGLKWFLQVGKG